MESTVAFPGAVRHGGAGLEEQRTMFYGKFRMIGAFSKCQSTAWCHRIAIVYYSHVVGLRLALECRNIILSPDSWFILIGQCLMPVFRSRSSQPVKESSKAHWWFKQKELMMSLLHCVEEVSKMSTVGFGDVACINFTVARMAWYIATLVLLLTPFLIPLRIVYHYGVCVHL